MTTAEMMQWLELRGCGLVEDQGDFALVYRQMDYTAKVKSHELKARSRAEAVVEAWGFLHPHPQAAMRVVAIIRRVEDDRRMTPGTIVSGRRHYETTEARHVAMLLAREATGATYAAIGAVFGTCHGTVMHGIESVQARERTEPKFAERLGATRVAVLEVAA